MASKKSIRLNKKEILDLKPDLTKNDYFPVENYKGLNVQVTKGGAKSFVIRYRVNGKPGTYKLGDFPAMTPELAAKSHPLARATINSGVDPNTEKQKARKAAQEAKRLAVTISDLSDRYIEEHLKLNNKPSWRKEATRLIEKIIRPELGKYPVSELTPGEVSNLLFKLHKTPTQARLTKAVLRTMLGRAEEWGLRPPGSNPVAAIKSRIKGANKKKDRHLSDLEIVAIGKAFRCSKESPITLALFRMYMLTGCRKSELIGDDYKEIPPLEWSSVDLEEGVISLEHHKTDGTIGTKIIPLCTAAQETLKKIPRVLGNPCVFPGRLPGRPIVNYTVLWKRLKSAVADMQLLLPESKRVDISDVDVHGLRHSFASVASRLKYPELFVAALLGHSANTVTQVYARLDADPLRDAVEVIGSRIAGLLDGTIDLEKEAEERRQIKENRLRQNA